MGGVRGRGTGQGPREAGAGDGGVMRTDLPMMHMAGGQRGVARFGYGDSALGMEFQIRAFCAWISDMGLHKSGLRAFQGGPNKQNLPLFLCLLIRNLMPFCTNIVLLKPNLKSKFIIKKICEKQGFSGPPEKARSPDLCLPF
jgi:hypothetical protein